MFEELSNKLEGALKALKGENKITEVNLGPALREVRRALIDADVNLSVVDDFLEVVKKEAIGEDVVRGLRPEQKFIEVVHRKLISMMGDSNEPILESVEKPTIIMLVGLQGAGKTTATAKLGLLMKRSGKRVLLIGADTFRPAAKDQLKTLGRECNIDVYTNDECSESLRIAEEGLNVGRKHNFDIVIVDTAGRLYIDDQLMNQAKTMKESICPHEILLVVDAMIGQEAADLTRAFNERIGITGAILTKLDGDSRGGAALSIRQISGKPIKFIGMGEKVEALEPFYPERMANRILGMGDILTLVDKAQREVEMQDVLTMQKKFEEASFDFTDFLRQMKLIKKMGSIGGLVKLIPGMNKIDDSTLKAGEVQLKKIESMIASMTVEERKEPQLLIKSQKRKRRIAYGSGFTETEVDKVILDFERMRKMMQNLAQGKIDGIQSMIQGVKKTKEGAGEDGIFENLKNRKEGKKKKGFFEL